MCESAMDAKLGNCDHLAASFSEKKQKNRSMSGLLVSKTVVKLQSVDSQKSGFAILLTFISDLCKSLILLVPRKGLEPPRSYPLVPETSASANSATWAQVRRARILEEK